METGSIKMLLYNAKKILKEAGIQEYALDAELFMMKAVGMDRIHIITEGDKMLTEEQLEYFNRCVNRRLKNEPTAYIIGSREFMGLDFYVENGVLIPRPDTEILVERVIEEAKKRNGKALVAEVGAGTGCISISIAKYTNAVCRCTDINPTAVKLARKNAELNNVSDRAFFYDGDIFKGLPKNGKYDIIVSNPPYINKADMETLMPDVKDYEPSNALFGGDDGMDFYRKIASDGFELLNAGGGIFFEIGYDEAEGVSEILINNGYTDIEVLKDLSGLDRVVSAYRRK